jgi:MFS transporter, AAHS family, 4-hydroxybenzoate transporter
MAHSVNVADVVDASKIGSFQIRCFILCALVALLDGFDAQAIAFVASALASKFNVPIAAFGPIFGAGTIGLALGALILPPFADRFGRKYQIVLATALFGVFSLATVWVDSFGMLALLRFLTGIGVGAAVPNLIPLTAEYAPKRMRALLITIVTSSWPMGAVLGGLVSSKMIPVYGWQSVFYLGGILPLVLVAILVPLLPESIRFLVNRSANPELIAGILRRIASGQTYSAQSTFTLPEENLTGFSVKHLLSGRRVAVTLLLWVSFFMNFLVLFFSFNWLPPLMQQAGQPIERAIIAVVAFNLGGIIGGVVMGRLMDKLGHFFVVGLAYAFGAVFVGAIGLVGFGLPLLLTTITLGGFCTVGTQVCGNALAAALYPTSVRSTGVGWAYGIGRIGSIVGPVVGGVLLTLHWGMRDLFLIAAIPLACAAIAVAFLAQASRRAAQA